MPIGAKSSTRSFRFKTRRPLPLLHAARVRLDTTALRPIEQWIPSRQNRAIESEAAEGGNLPRAWKARICDFACGRWPHPLMARGVRDMVDALGVSAIENETTIAGMRLGGEEERGRIGGPVRVDGGGFDERCRRRGGRR